MEFCFRCYYSKLCFYRVFHDTQQTYNFHIIILIRYLFIIFNTPFIKSQRPKCKPLNFQLPRSYIQVSVARANKLHRLEVAGGKRRFSSIVKTKPRVNTKGWRHSSEGFHQARHRTNASFIPTF